MKAPQLLKRFSDGVDFPVEAVGEGRHRQFYDLVSRRIETGRLGVDEQALPHLDACRRLYRRPRREFAEHAIGPGRFKLGGQRLQIGRLLRIGLNVDQAALSDSGRSDISGVTLPC